MHDHEFERQVHQKMEGLHLDPSDAVWEQVEGQLHRKKRRRIVFWIPLLLAVLFTGGYILQHDFHPKRTAAFSSNTGLSSDNKKETSLGETKTTENTSTGRSTTLSGSLQQAGMAPAIGKNKKQAATLNNTPHLAPVYILRNENRRTGENGYTATSLKQGITTPGSLGEERKLLSLAETVINQADSLTFNEPVAAAVPPVSYLHIPFSTLFASPPNEGVAIQTVGLSNKRRLHLGIHAAIIRTSIYDGSGKLFSDKSLADQALANQNAMANPNTGSMVVSKPSVVRAGTGFSAGFFLRKEIGRGWSLSAGLDYTLYHTSIQIGRSRDSSLAQFNASGADRYFLTGNGSNSRPYTNSYHFIGLPLLLQFQLNRGKLPIVWEGGVEFTRLLTSNALHYSSTLNGYYKNNRLLNHTQFYVLTGLQLKAFSNTRHPVNIGPQLQVGLTNLSTRSSGKQEHLTQYGLKISTVIK